MSAYFTLTILTTEK